MMIVSQFRQLNLSVVNVRTYLFAVLFVGGNMLLPQLCHLMPDRACLNFKRCKILKLIGSRSCSHFVCNYIKIF